MLRTRLATAVALSFLFGLPNAQAQAPIEQFLDEKHVKEALQTALENIQHGKCDDGKNCTPATKAEFKNPPLTLDQARGAIKAGIVSGTMQWCDLSWEDRNFEPFLIHYKNTEDLNTRQLALLALVHGFHQKAIYVQLSKKGPCPSETAKSMSSQMPLENLEKD